MERSRFDGQRDIARAADSLATRLPDPLARARAARLQLRWSWQAGGEDLFRSIDPPTLAARRSATRCGCCRRRPARRSPRAAADDRGFVARVRRLPRARWPPSLRESPPAATSEPNGPARLLLRRVRRARLAADLLRRPGRARGRLPQAGLRRRHAAGRGRPALPPGLLSPARRRRRSAARVLGRHRSGAASGGARHRRATARRSPWSCRSPDEPVERADLARRRRARAALPARQRPAREHAARRAGSPRGCTSARRELRLAQYLLLGVGGVRALAGDGHRAPAAAPQRGSRRLRRDRAGAPRVGRSGGRRAGDRARPCAARVHDAHAGARRQRLLPGRAGRGGCRRLRGGGRNRRRGRRDGWAARTRRRLQSRSGSRNSHCAHPRQPTA